jgi:hypothetical protein
MNDAQQQNLDVLLRVFDGVTLTPEETKTLEWLAAWERPVVENVARLVLKAREAQVALVFADFERMGQEMIDTERKDGGG